jgi:hypothetical protein
MSVGSKGQNWVYRGCIVDDMGSFEGMAMGSGGGMGKLVGFGAVVYRMGMGNNSEVERKDLCVDECG